METFLAILILTTLALLATSPALYRLRRQPLMSILMTGGWVAIGAGLVLGPSGTSQITRESLQTATPLLMMGLGWIGFMVGLQARRDVIATVLKETWRLVTLDVVITILVFGAACWFLVARWTQAPSAAWLVVPAALLTACSIGWSIETRSLVRDRSMQQAQHCAMLLRASGTLCSIAAIVWLGLWFDLPGHDESGVIRLDWLRGARNLLISTVLAILMGLLGQIAFRRAGKHPEQQMVVSLGLVVFVAGLATELSTSPLLASMLTGIVIANLAGNEFQRFQKLIINAEHVIAVVMALLAGLFMNIDLGVGALILVGAIIVLRVAVKPAVFRAGIAAQGNDEDVRRLRTLGPIRQNPLAVPLAVGLVLKQPSDFNGQLLTVVVLTGLILDVAPVLIQFFAKRSEQSVAREEAA